MPARRDDDEACSQNQNAASRARTTQTAALDSSSGLAKRVFGSWDIPLLNKRNTLITSGA